MLAVRSLSAGIFTMKPTVMQRPFYGPCLLRPQGCLDALYRTFGSQRFDLVIDDGLYAPGANLNVLEFALQHLRPGGYVVIEDIKWCAALSRRIEHDLL